MRKERGMEEEVLEYWIRVDGLGVDSWVEGGILLAGKRKAENLNVGSGSPLYGMMVQYNQ